MCGTLYTPGNEMTCGNECAIQYSKTHLQKWLADPSNVRRRDEICEIWKAKNECAASDYGSIISYAKKRLGKPKSRRKNSAN